MTMDMAEGDEIPIVDVVDVPRIGMTFNSENEAYDFYNAYGGGVGFSVRRDYCNRSRKDKTIITSRMLVCNKHGIRKKDKRDGDTIKPRAEIRTNCPAQMAIVRLDNGQFQCHDFVEGHNHVLHEPATLHMLRSQRKVSEAQAYEIDLSYDSGIRPNAIFEYMGRQVGGRQNLGYIRQDQNNYLRSKRQRDLSYGEAGSLLRYFEKQSRDNPSFTFSLQLDSAEQITNVFWVDAKMVRDYTHFGDVVTFDTTFGTNKELRPFGVFAGFNHHRGAVIFGAALLYDETAESFNWLFEEFLKALGQKKPMTIFTDQDAAMAKAIKDVFPETWHGLCTLHIMQNALKHLGHLIQDGSSILKDFNACMFEYEEVLEFENTWENLRTDFAVEDGSWLDRIYGLKEKWAKCYMKKTFTIGMRSTQLSESLNADLKDYLKSSFDVVQFFNHFEVDVKDKRDNELKVDFDARNKLPRHFFFRSPVIKQAGEVYTPKILEEFQEEFGWVSAYCIKSRNESSVFCEYVVVIAGKKKEFKVMCNPSEPRIECSCRKFETYGILCYRALKILDFLEIKFIPPAYIMQRWTRAARNMVVEDNEGNQVEEDVHLDYIERYRLICSKLIKIAVQCSNSAEGYVLVNKAANELCIQLQNLAVDTPHPGVTSDDHTMRRAKGLKKKEGCKGGK